MPPNRFTIRNINPELMHEARVIAVQNRLTLGEFLSDALHQYIENLPTWEEDESEPTVAHTTEDPHLSKQAHMATDGTPAR